MDGGNSNTAKDSMGKKIYLLFVEPLICYQTTSKLYHYYFNVNVNAPLHVILLLMISKV